MVRDIVIHNIRDGFKISDGSIIPYFIKYSSGNKKIKPLTGFTLPKAGFYLDTLDKKNRYDNLNLEFT